MMEKQVSGTMFKNARIGERTPAEIQVQERHYSANESRPEVTGIIISGRRGRILSTLYTAAGNRAHPTVLLLHGIPGYEQNLDLAQCLQRNGFHVLTFHYSGSWGSDGDYALSNDLEDANTVLDYILQDQTFRFDKTRLYCIGHSLGGFVCAHLTARRKEIQGGILLMPFNVAHACNEKLTDAATVQNVKALLEDSAPWLCGTTGEKLFQEASGRAEEFCLENLAQELALKPLMCITGAQDRDTPAHANWTPLEQALREIGGTRFVHIEYPTSHCFCDYRLTVVRRVCDFLKQLHGDCNLT